MPEWNDNVILLSSKPHGETGMLTSVFSKYNGRYKAFVYGGNSPKKRSTFQKGNLCNAYWKARMPEQMGSIKLELLKSIAPNIMNSPIQLSALLSVCEISENILPEREPNQKLYDATIKLFDVLHLSDNSNFTWVKGYINWELGLLSELGFSLKLDQCAVKADSTDLAFVSPKTGRAVSYGVGFPYKNKLFVLPNFLGGNYYQENLNVDLLNGLFLTKYFINLNFFKNIKLPASRIRFENQLEKEFLRIL